MQKAKLLTGGLMRTTDLRSSIVAIACAALVLSSPAVASATVPSSAAASAATPARMPSQWRSKRGKPLPVIPLGSLDRTSGYLFQVELTNEGAGVYTVKLSRYYATAHDKQLAEAADNYEDYRRRRAKDPEKYKGQYSLLNPVLYEGKRFLPLGTRRMAVRIGKTEEVTLAPTYWRLMPKKTTPDGKSESVSFQKTYNFRGDLDDPAKTPTSDHKTHPMLRIVKTYRVQKNDYTILPAVDAVVLTGGIGENSLPIRSAICTALARLGAVPDDDRNLATVGGRTGPITTDDSDLPIWVVATNEELMIARDIQRLVTA